MSLSIGFVVTMTSLVLGMLVSLVQVFLRRSETSCGGGASKIIPLDRALADYGPETNMIHSQTRGYLEAVLHRVWPREAFTPVPLQPGDYVDKIEHQLRNLTPKNDDQSSAKLQAMDLLADLRRSGLVAFVVFSFAANSCLTFKAMASVSTR
jgi:hypothetical protein